MLQIIITKKNTRILLRGGVWVYADEIVKTIGDTNEDICEVISDKNVYLGTAFYNQKKQNTCTIAYLSKSSYD